MPRYRSYRFPVFAMLSCLLALGGCREAVVAPPARLTAVPADATLQPHNWTYVHRSPGTTVQTSVILRDADGNPIQHEQVRWLVKSGGGSFENEFSMTDGTGVATQNWTLGPPGYQRAKAVVAGLTPVAFDANSVVDGATVTKLSGDGQIRDLGERFTAFSLRATDAASAPIAGVAVTWVITSGNGMLRRVSTSTDANGTASAKLDPSPTVQAFTVDARVAGVGGASFSVRATDGSEIVFDTIATGLARPVYVTAPPGDARLFVVELSGRIRIMKNGVFLPTPFLDIHSNVLSSGEHGMFSMVFHPQYASNGFFFVNYTDLDGTSRIERYHATPGSDVADPGSMKLILTQTQPIGSHNGGHMLFGPDGRLFIPFGDGGGNNDPNRNGQNLGTWLAKIVRVNVDVANRPYLVPHDNPFLDNPDALPEIWALGLRNPWRIAFDNGLLYVADVGEGQREEVNVVGARTGGVNYGWRIMEGSICRGVPGCDQTGLTLPVLDYDHTQGCSITGGFVYRGTDLPEIVGTYFYTDFCAGWVRSFRYVDGQVRATRQWDQLGTLTNPTSFGVDGQGELYITTYDGLIVKFVRRATP